MKVNYQEKLEETTTELKIIRAQQRTVTNRQKVQALYLLKSEPSQSITHVAELLGVHRITVQRWLGVAKLRYDKCGQGMFWLPDLPRLRAIEMI